MTTDITELAQREKFEAWWEREYKHLESSKYTDAVPHIKYGFWMAYQAGGAELVEALEYYKSREERVTSLVRDNSKSWDELYRQVEAKGKRNVELVEALESEKRICATWRKTAESTGEKLEKAQTINAAAEKLVRCKGRYHSEQNYRALAALFGVNTPDLPPLDSESRTVTIEPFRSFVTDADLAALHRFAECCDDPESGGHDLEKEQVRRLEAIGALQRSGRISYITGFGDVLISITAGIKVEAE